MTRAVLENEIRDLILSAVDMEGLSAEALTPDAPLFGEGIGLDSIDALEIGAALRKKYGVKFKASAEENRAYFRSVSSLADFIARNKGLDLE